MKDVTKLGIENLALDLHEDGVLVATLNRPDKRNALNAQTIEELVTLFSAIPQSGVRAVVLAAKGDHFCAGLDLVEHHKQDRSPAEFMHICLRWHEAFNKMEYGGVPIIAALQGAVVGGGLELASAAHIRVADQTAYFALPEGQRGLFTGGGATIRVADLVGKARMIDMMLTGRIYKGQEAVDVGLAQYLVRRLKLRQGARTRPPRRRQPAPHQLRHLFGHQPHAEHVQLRRRLCGSGGGGHRQHAACGAGTAGGFCGQDGGEDQAIVIL